MNSVDKQFLVAFKVSFFVVSMYKLCLKYGFGELGVISK